MDQQHNFNTQTACPDDPDCSSLPEIRMVPDARLLDMLDHSARFMQISREDLVLKILKVWEKKNTLPLRGKNGLCTISLDECEDMDR
jgi:hypothetical protein